MTGRLLVIGPSSTMVFATLAHHLDTMSVLLIDPNPITPTVDELVYELTAAIECSEYIEPLKTNNPKDKGHERNYNRPFYHGIKRKR